jgi:putative phage-type endonuclease
MNKDIDYYNTISELLVDTTDDDYLNHDDKNKLIEHVKSTLSFIHKNVNSNLVDNILGKMFKTCYYVDSDYEFQKILPPKLVVPTDFKSLMNQFNYLSTLPQFEQKSKEWFDARNHKITASSIATALGENPYPNQSPYDLILEKCGKGPPFPDNKFVHHGKKYEEVATMIYQHIYNTRVTEFGLLPHPRHSFIGASPDGICNQYTMDYEFNDRLGVMLEIKCPYSRKIKTKGKIDGEICPHYYWDQVQVQLECCNLEICDFFQCDLMEYETRNEWLLDDCKDCANTEEQDKVKYIPSFARKGCIIQLLPKDRILNEDDACSDYKIWGAKYIYPKDLSMSCQEYDEWVLNIINDFENYDSELARDYVFDKVLYWKLKKSHNVAVKRDRKWFNDVLPKLKSVWDKVLYYRKHLNKVEKYVAEMKKKFKPPNKYSKFKPKTFSPQGTNTSFKEDLFMSDSDSVSTIAATASSSSNAFIDTSSESECLIITETDSDNEYDDNEDGEDDIFL